MSNWSLTGTESLYPPQEETRGEGEEGEEGDGTLPLEGPCAV